MALSAPLILAALAWTVFHRAGWYDEFYTLYVTQPRFGWGEALSRHWLPDNHPPLYYALVRATGWLGGSLEARRLVNLLIAVTALVGGWAVVRGAAPDAHRRLATYYFVFLASLASPLALVGELRSYFLSFCSVALLVLTTVLIQLDPKSAGPARQVVLWGAALAAFNTHIVTTVIAAALLLPFLALALLRRDVSRFRAIAVPALVGGTLSLITVAVQWRLWIGNMAVFWLPAGTAQALFALRLTLLAAVLAHALMALAAVVGFYRLARRGWSEGLMVALLLLLGVAIAGAVLVALHAWRPLLIPKYLIGLFPPIGMIVAIGFGAAVEAFGRRAGGALTLAAVGLLGLATWQNLAAVAAFRGWDPAAATVAREVAKCPDTVVHAETRWNAYLASLQPPDNARVVPFAYRLVAERNGFAVEPAGSRRVSRGCPTLFWGQTAGQPMPAADAVLVYERGRGFALPKLWFYRIGDGWIAADRPLAIPPELLAPRTGPARGG